MPTPKHPAAMTLREARVLIASRAMSRTEEPKLLEAARVVLRELDRSLRVVPHADEAPVAPRGNDAIGS